MKRRIITIAGILLIGLLLLTTSCKKEDLYIEPETTETLEDTLEVIEEEPIDTIVVEPIDTIITEPIEIIPDNNLVGHVIRFVRWESYRIIGNYEEEYTTEYYKGGTIPSPENITFFNDNIYQYGGYENEYEYEYNGDNYLYLHDLQFIGTYIRIDKWEINDFTGGFKDEGVMEFLSIDGYSYIFKLEYELVK